MATTAGTRAAVRSTFVPHKIAVVRLRSGVETKERLIPTRGNSYETVSEDGLRPVAASILAGACGADGLRYPWVIFHP